MDRGCDVQGCRGVASICLALAQGGVTSVCRRCCEEMTAPGGGFGGYERVGALNAR